MYALYAPCEGYRVCLNGHEKGHYNHKVQVHQWSSRNGEIASLSLMNRVHFYPFFRIKNSYSKCYMN